MSSKKVREMLRQRRMEFDLAVEKNRAEMEQTEKIENMTKAQLIEYAEANGIEINKAAKKAVIVEAIKER